MTKNEKSSGSNSTFYDFENYTFYDLEKLSVLQGIPGPSIEWFWNQSTLRQLKQDEIISIKGDPITNTMVILEGQICILRINDKKQNVRIIIEQGSITGYLPFSRIDKNMGETRATKNSLILIFPKDKIREMIHDHYELTEALVHQMSTRIRDFTNLQQLNEKMMALGKLSAGLAHELNNPAAAIARSSSIMLEKLHELPTKFIDLFSLCLSPVQAERIVELLHNKMTSTNQVVRLSPMQRSEREDELCSRLEKLQIKHADKISDNLLEFSYSNQELDELEAVLDPQKYSVVYNWFSDLLGSERIVQEINEAGKRISDLVKSVKVFTHMDQGNDMQLSDIHDGIRNTITMLNYRLKKGNIKLITEFDETIPKINVLIGELNQVWTNLIDNALDAMEDFGSGELKISTQKDQTYIRINICDTGTGIPKEIQTRVYEPFFTTKEIGKGTGLGLESAFGIIKHHNGTLNFKSVPGNTCFTVSLPIQ